VVKSLLAQYEAYALEKDASWINKCSISYMKSLLLPSRIWDFGFHDGLSIDCKMKTVYQTVGKAGASGGNVEMHAVRGILRSIALWPVIDEMRMQKLKQQMVINFDCASRFSYLKPITAINEAAMLTEVLKYNYGGDFGTAVNTAFACFNTGVSVEDTTVDSIQPYHKLIQSTACPSRFFGTYQYDWLNATRSVRNNVSRPRLSSTALVKMPDGEEFAMRIQVSSKRRHLTF
jgi:hypothetical protein